MSGDGVTLKVDVWDTASAGLRRLMLRTGSIDMALDEIGGSLVTSTQKRIEDEQDPEGNQFKGHAPATVAKRGPGATILRDEIDLFDSVNHDVQGSKVLVGVNRIYGRIQQLGGEAGRASARVTIPARPYLGISDDDATEIGNIVSDHIKRIQ